MRTPTDSATYLPGSPARVTFCDAAVLFWLSTQINSNDLQGREWRFRSAGDKPPCSLGQWDPHHDRMANQLVCRAGPHRKAVIWAFLSWSTRSTRRVWVAWWSSADSVGGKFRFRQCSWTGKRGRYRELCLTINSASSMAVWSAGWINGKHASQDSRPYRKFSSSLKNLKL